MVSFIIYLQCTHPAQSHLAWPMYPSFLLSSLRREVADSEPDRHSLQADIPWCRSGLPDFPVQGRLLLSPGSNLRPWCWRQLDKPPAYSFLLQRVSNRRLDCNRYPGSSGRHLHEGKKMKCLLDYLWIIRSLPNLLQTGNAMPKVSDSSGTHSAPNGSVSLQTRLVFLRQDSSSSLVDTSYSIFAK